MKIAFKVRNKMDLLNDERVYFVRPLLQSSLKVFEVRITTFKHEISLEILVNLLQYNFNFQSINPKC